MISTSWVVAHNSPLALAGDLLLEGVSELPTCVATNKQAHKGRPTA